MFQEEDIKLIAKYLTYCEQKEDTHIWQYGDPAENFYFVLRGRVTMQEPNTAIANWEWAYTLYMQLKLWVTEVLNPKIKNQM